MKTRIFSFLIFLFAFPFFIQGQTTIHVVYLKDGTLLKGYLLNDKKDEPLRLASLAGQEFEILQSSINYISTYTTDQTVIEHGKTLASDGWYKTFLFGMMPTRVENRFGIDDISLGLNLINFSMGYQFNQQVAVGAGFGWDTYDMSIAAFHMEFRGFINTKKVSPYYSLQTGYGIAFDPLYAWDKDRYKLRGGPLLHPAFGFRFATRNKANFLLEMGLRFQWAEQEDTLRMRVDKLIYQRLNLRFGWKF